MIKKQLGVLAGSLMLAAGSHAAITAGASGVDSTAILVFSSVGQGSFVMDTGLTAGQLAAGNGFSLDISGVAAALGGTIESYALFGALGGTSNAFSYAATSYVDVNGGVVYAQSAVNPAMTSADLKNNTILARVYINNVSVGGLFAEGTLGDLDSTSANLVFALLTPSAALGSLYTNTLVALEDPNSTVAGVTILNPLGTQNGTYIEGDNFVVSAEAVGAVPVPAAAWLFGSALLSLGVIRRK